MHFASEDTIAAPATVPGAGAISIIRVSGSGTFAVADSVISFRSGRCSVFEGYSIHFGSIYLPDGELLDNVLVSVFRAPHSYTGEDSVEISCHASSYIVSSLMMLLLDAGARAAEPGEFTRRAYLNGKMDLAQAESVADIIAAEDAASHRIAVRQMRGGFSQELKDLADNLLEMTALMELELDFSEEDVEFADRGKLNDLLDRVLSHIDSLLSSFRLGNAIKNGIPVTIAGAANTGKSTLLNALLGEDRAIVSDIAGTTRDTVEETVTIGDCRFRFIDTAGIRSTGETIEQLGIERSLRKIEDASIVLGVVDLSDAEDVIASQIESLRSRIDFSRQQFVLLQNKADLGDKQIAYDGPHFRISARTGLGLPALRDWLASYEKDRIAGAGSETLLTNLRHFQALNEARTALLRVRDGLATSLPTDLVSQDLREAIRSLQSILGTSTPDVESTLGLIFSRFCIGK